MKKYEQDGYIKIYRLHENRYPNVQNEIQPKSLDERR
jgi:hypothetical protein